jgi:TonB family protein
MNTRFLLSLLALLLPGLGLAASAAVTASAGYEVVLEMKINEEGVVQDATVVSSDDTSADHILELLAMDAARNTKVPPRMKDGKPAKFTARAPFLFDVEGDEGPAANNAPKPKLRTAPQPVYPAELAAQGVVGGAILELVVGTGGNITSLQVLRSSHPEFAAAATAAVQQWVFAPALNNGVAVESRWRLAVSFESEALRADWKWRFAPRPSLGNYAVVHRVPASAPVPAPGK